MLLTMLEQFEATNHNKVYSFSKRPYLKGMSEIIIISHNGDMICRIIVQETIIDDTTTLIKEIRKNLLALYSVTFSYI